MTREPKCVIIESMERIDVLKGIEQIARMLWHDADRNERSDWVGKSAVRDMRSIPTIKNMGF